MVIGSPVWWTFLFPSMKVPPKRKGNFSDFGDDGVHAGVPSMKVPPKRKGN